MRKDTKTFRSAARRTSARLTSSPADFPAPKLAKPGKGSVSLASTAASGGKCIGSSANCDRVGALLRTFVHSSLTKEGTRLSMRWKRRVTPCGRWWWGLEFSERRMSARGSGLFATLTATMILEPVKSERFRRQRSGRLVKRSAVGGEFALNWAERLAMLGVLPTRRLGELFMGFPTHWTDVPSPRSAMLSSRKSR